MVESKIDYLPLCNEMISTFDYIQKYTARTKQLLGISYEQFMELINCAKQYHKEEKLKLRMYNIAKVLLFR